MATDAPMVKYSGKKQVVPAKKQVKKPKKLKKKK